MTIELNEVVFFPQGTAKLCQMPYPGHPRGCPCFGKKKGCPPSCPRLDEVLDLNLPVFAIINAFDLGSHIEKMRVKHPNWTERQLRNVLYWQPGARKKLRSRIADFRAAAPEYYIETNPEARGVNVTETLRKSGIILECPPKKTAMQVAVAGIPKGYNHGR